MYEMILLRMPLRHILDTVHMIVYIHYGLAHIHVSNVSNHHENKPI